MDGDSRRKSGGIYAVAVAVKKDVVAVTDALPITGAVFQTWFVSPSVHVQI